MKVGDFLYMQLSKEHSLYCLNEEKFNLFITSAKKHTFEDYVSHAASLNSLDSYAIVLQIWCLLNEDELHLIINPEKMIPYSIDCYILKLLRSDKKIKQFLQSRVNTQDMKYIAAYFLACATLRWGDAIILAHKEGQVLCETNNARNYFLVAAEEDLAHVENVEFYQFQKTIVHLMVSDYQQTSRFHDEIDNAIKLIRQYLYKIA